MKDWEELLIKLYYSICNFYEEDLKWYSQRYSNNTNWLESQALEFTDEEAISIFLFGILQKRRNTLEIYTYTKDHLESWFPQLPSYQKFNERLNRLSPSLGRLVHRLLLEVKFPEWLIQSQNLIDTLVDSMPIMLAKGSRSDSAKVALEVADKGYCASKKLYYHGLKLHHLGLSVPSTLPIPLQLDLSKASANDNRIFKEQIATLYRDLRVYGDKIYFDKEVFEDFQKDYRVHVLACQKRKKGQKHLFADQKFFNTMISQIRQPIESFFNWLEQKTSIQMASKVRSLKGLFKHVYGKLAAALFLLIF